MHMSTYVHSSLNRPKCISKTVSVLYGLCIMSTPTRVDFMQFILQNTCLCNRNSCGRAHLLAASS